MPKQGFPTRKERKDLLKELRRMEQELGQEFSSSALYQAYSDALNKLDQKMEQLYELGDMGLPPAVSAKDKEELLELLTNVGKTGEQFLGDAQEKGQDLNKGIFQVVNRMQGMLAKDSRPSPSMIRRSVRRISPSCRSTPGPRPSTSGTITLRPWAICSPPAFP